MRRLTCIVPFCEEVIYPFFFCKVHNQLFKCFERRAKSYPRQEFMYAKVLTLTKNNIDWYIKEEAS